jgi:FkbM family methyltransferase
MKSPFNFIGRELERAGRQLRALGQPNETWIDVGAHLGETTFEFAAANPHLTVYAFEPNLKLAAQRMGLLPNFIVLPFAVAEHDGSATLFLNRFDAASSLLAFNPKGLSQWTGHEELQIEGAATVATIRLDTFLNAAGISRVNYLKIDAQGADLQVLKSAGHRIRDIGKIMFEVGLTSTPLYEGSCSRAECLKFMAAAGFTLVDEQLQAHNQEANLTFVPAGGDEAIAAMSGRPTLVMEEKRSA